MRILIGRIRSLLSLHRRIVAALLAAGAVLLVTHSLRTGPPTTPVVVVVADVEAGHTISSEDVAVRELPIEAIPVDALTTAAGIAGRPAAVALAAGTVLHPSLLGRGASAPGLTLVPVLLGDDGVRSMLRPGDVISLVAVEEEGAVVVASGVRVVAMTDTAPQSTLTVTARSPAPVLIEATSGEAPQLAALGQTGQLSIVFGAA